MQCGKNDRFNVQLQGRYTVHSGRYTVQGHSRSLISVPVESLSVESQGFPIRLIE